MTSQEGSASQGFFSEGATKAVSVEFRIEFEVDGGLLPFSSLPEQSLMQSNTCLWTLPAMLQSS